MASTSDGHRRSPRAPKPIGVPLTAMLVGAALYVVGLGVIGNIDVAALGMILFFWGLVSSATLLISRRLRARRAARGRV